MSAMLGNALISTLARPMRCPSSPDEVAGEESRTLTPTMLQQVASPYPLVSMGAMWGAMMRQFCSTHPDRHQ